MNTPITAVPGIGPHMAGCFAELNISTAEKLAEATPSVLAKVKGVGPVRAKQLSNAARVVISTKSNSSIAPEKAATPEPLADTDVLVTTTETPKEGKKMGKAKDEKKAKKAKELKKEKKAKKVKKQAKINKKSAKKDTKKSKKTAKNKKKDTKKKGKKKKK